MTQSEILGQISC